MEIVYLAHLPISTKANVNKGRAKPNGIDSNSRMAVFEPAPEQGEA
jgi:hypothetical protein